MSWEQSTIIVLLSFTYLFFWQARLLDNNAEDVHKWLKLLFYFMGWAGIISTMGILHLIIEQSAPTALKVLRMIDVTWYILITISGLVMMYWLFFFAMQYYKVGLAKIKPRQRGKPLWA